MEKEEGWKERENGMMRKENRRNREWKEADE